jgi:hypothetical protein
VAQQAKTREQPLLLTEEAEMVSPLFPSGGSPGWHWEKNHFKILN